MGTTRHSNTLKPKTVPEHLEMPLLWREQWIIVMVMVGLFVVGWSYMSHVASTNFHGHLPLVEPHMLPWTPSDFQAAFLMWSLMMVGMMLPAVAPWIWVLSVGGTDKPKSPGTRPLIFLSGYLLVWTTYSLLAALLQWLLHDLFLFQTIPSWFAGTLAVMAGLYQLSPSRLACLKHCRSPLTFFLSHWKPGWRGALAMGLHHGLFCVACCWALMLLSLTAGIMNLLWMVGITLFVFLDHCVWERNLPGRIAGFGLVGWGLWLLLPAVV